MDSKETSLFTIHVLIVSYCFCLFGEFAKILKGKSDMDKQLICKSSRKSESQFSILSTKLDKDFFRCPLY